LHSEVCFNLGWHIRGLVLARKNTPSDSATGAIGRLRHFDEPVKGRVLWMDGTEVMWNAEQTFQLSSKKTNPQGN